MEHLVVVFGTLLIPNKFQKSFFDYLTNDQMTHLHGGGLWNWGTKRGLKVTGKTLHKYLL